MPSSDSHVTIVPYFTVPEGKMDEFKSNFGAFYKLVKENEKACLYYSFTICGNKVMCREGYKSADAVSAHLANVKEPLDKALAIVGEGGLDLSVMGPAKELEKLKEAMTPLGTKFWETDGGSMWFRGCEEGPDTHVTIVPYFTPADGKMKEFTDGFGAFFKGVRRGTKECLYYGFATDGKKVFCREGYKSAEGALAHLKDVKEPLDKAVALCGEGGLDLSVMGPASELEKMKEALTPLGAKFYELDEGGFWMPGPAAPKVAPAPEGATEMKVTMKKGVGFYVNAACSFLRGVEAKPAEEGKEATEAKPPVENLRISGLGEAVNVAVTAASKAESADLASIVKIQTAYPSMEGSGRGCAQIVIDLKKK